METKNRTVIVNGVVIEGSVGSGVNIASGNITINGKKVDMSQFGTDKVFNIVVQGDCPSLEIDCANNIKIEGSAGKVSASNGSVTVGGDVSGNVKTTNGSINVNGTIHGDADTVNGSIKFKR